MKKTKEEVIKEAWGNDYPKNGVDDNGWSKDCYSHGTFDWELFDSEDGYVMPKIRPKLLQGVENNNGWIKIESEDDLPKDGYYFVVYKNGKMSDCPKDSDFEDDNYWMQHITHYQPIVKPKPPLY